MDQIEHEDKNYIKLMGDKDDEELPKRYIGEKRL